VKECSESCDQFEYHAFLLSQDHANPSKVEKCEICDDRDLCNGMQTTTTTLAVFVNPTEEPCNTEHLANYKNKNSECFAKISQSIQNCTLGQGGGRYFSIYCIKCINKKLFLVLPPATRQSSQKKAWASIKWAVDTCWL
jgi:hypothetical protein